MELVSEYEETRRRNIERNQQFLQQLGLGAIQAGLSAAAKKKVRRPRPVLSLLNASACVTPAFVCMVLCAWCCAHGAADSHQPQTRKRKLGEQPSEPVERRRSARIQGIKQVEFDVRWRRQHVQ